MKLSEAREHVRVLAEDTAVDYLWSDAEIDFRLNEAQFQACRRAHLLTASDDDGLCNIDIEAGTLFSDLSPRILTVRSVRIDGQTCSLEKIHHEDIDAIYPDFRTQTGVISGYNLSLNRGQIAWLYKPVINQKAILNVTYLPEILKSGEDKFAIAEHHQFALFDWALHKMFLKPGSETYQRQRSDEHLTAFEAEFGKPLSAIEEVWQAENYGFTDDGSR